MGMRRARQLVEHPKRRKKGCGVDGLEFGRRYEVDVDGDLVAVRYAGGYSRRTGQPVLELDRVNA